MDIQEAKEFLKTVREYAANSSMKATAQAMNTKIGVFKTKLIDALIATQESAPSFLKVRGKSSTKNNVLKIQASGRGGSAKKIVIPQTTFTKLGWEVNDELLLKISGKKITLTKKESA